MNKLAIRLLGTLLMSEHLHATEPFVIIDYTKINARQYCVYNGQLYTRGIRIKTDTGTLVYQLGSRNASTFLRLNDGETQVLAGLISDEDRTGANKVPGFGDLPLLGRLFSNQRDELMKTEIVMLLTPRIIRSIERPELAEGEFFAGTESAASDQPMQLRPAMATPALPAPVRPEEPEPAPAPDLTSATEPAAEPPPPADRRVLLRHQPQCRPARPPAHRTSLCRALCVTSRW